MAAQTLQERIETLLNQLQNPNLTEREITLIERKVEFLQRTHQ